MEGETSWLYAPPKQWPKAFNPKGITGQILYQPLRLLHTQMERTYLEEQIVKAKWTNRMGLRVLTSYAVLLMFWQLDFMSTIRAEDEFVATYMVTLIFHSLHVFFDQRHGRPPKILPLSSKTSGTDEAAQPNYSKYRTCIGKARSQLKYSRNRHTLFSLQLLTDGDQQGREDAIPCFEIPETLSPTYELACDYTNFLYACSAYSLRR
jgi:hypothetical protein